MENFTIKNFYEENGRRVLEINLLPEKYCNFDCIFCPVGRSQHQTDAVTGFGSITAALAGLGEKIRELRPQLVFINSLGEALIHENLKEIIDFIHTEGCAVRLLSNGYLLGREQYAQLANMCEEVIGEIKTVNETDFQTVQRPLQGYTLKEYIEGMARFSRQYTGHFILEVSIIKKYTDSDEAVSKLQQFITAIKPDELQIADIGDDRFRKVLGVTPERLAEVSALLHL